MEVMGIILKTTIPQQSLVHTVVKSIHYSDSYKAEFRTLRTVQVKDMMRFLLNYNPKWVQWLMYIRNLLVKPLGLQTDADEAPILSISKGNKASVFEILECTDEEVVLYYADKHLDASLSVMLNKLHHQHEMIVTTTVHYNNNLGRVYFFFVKPFHILIIKTMIIQMIKQFS